MTNSESTTAIAEATDDSVRATVEIAVPPEEVFEALTDPAQLEEWWGTPESYRTSDWRLEPSAGGEWSVRTEAPDGTEASVHGEYRVVDPPRTLEFTWAASWNDFTETTVRFDLVPAVVRGAPGTRVTVTHSGLGALDIRARACAGCVAGASFALDWPRLLASFMVALHERLVLA
ncbi:MAG TPA: SRPBCC domain-containing protein [Gemmatimonadaceae bacterium]|nr:SRPBCC domain-containing protein [Gemmatimonadaceae bacterium]